MTTAPPPATFGEWLNRERLRRELSGRALERRAGKSLRWYLDDRWPADRMPPLQGIQAIARGLGMDWLDVEAVLRGYIVGSHSDASAPSVEVEAITDVVSRRSADQRRLLMDVVLLVAQGLDRLEDRYADRLADTDDTA